MDISKAEHLYLSKDLVPDSDYFVNYLYPGRKKQSIIDSRLIRDKINTQLAASLNMWIKYLRVVATVLIIHMHIKYQSYRYKFNLS